MKTNMEDSKYIAEYKVKSSVIAATNTSSTPGNIIPVMEIDWELLSKEKSDYIDKEKMKRAYNKFADFDKNLANMGLEEYSEGLEKIDSQ